MQSAQAVLQSPEYTAPVTGGHGIHFAMPDSLLWSDTLLIPVYWTGISAVILTLHCLFSTELLKRFSSRFRSNAKVTGEPNPSFVASPGGAYLLTQLTGCLMLLALSAIPTFCNAYYEAEKLWLNAAMCLSFTYASALALLAMSVSPKWSQLLSRHLLFQLLVLFGVYTYRDVWPLATYVIAPKDIAEGWVLWAKITVLSLVAVILPLSTSRPYVPTNPQEPMPKPSSEQTASILSLITFSFMDSFFYLSQRLPKIPPDQLPPLPDYDKSKYLVSKEFPDLDVFLGAKKRHIFFGLLKVFGIEYIMLTVVLVIQVFVAFVSPLAINRLLHQLENHGEGAIVKPWFWILCIFAGSVADLGLMQWYFYYIMKMVIRTEALLTQLVFEHSFRIRLKAETPASASATGDNRTPSADSSEAVEASPKNLIGKINNLITADLSSITDSRDFLPVMIYTPMQVIFGIVFLYAVMGWSAFVGLFVMVALFPTQGLITKKLHSVQAVRMEKADARVQTVGEVINVVRMIKLFGWGAKMDEKIQEKRKEELRWIRKGKILELIITNLSETIPIVTMLSTFATYTLVMKQELNASQVFSSMAVFEMLRWQLQLVSFIIPQIVRGKISIDRFNDFLHGTELLDSFSERQHTFPLEIQHDRELIGIQHAAFSWSDHSSDGSSTPSSRDFRLNIADEVIFKRGCINLIVGPTGSGKTSLLMALLGEMHFLPTGPNSWFNLPREGGIAYAAQESWIQNKTIRENIIFGSTFDEDRYKKVLNHCALERDLELFEAGDQTEVGEMGITLSGGQKARITLARAVYSSAAILLLDDVLAALDVHTSKWIVDKCLGGELIKGRTVLLVTHNVDLTSPIADFVVALGSDGQIISQGSDVSAAVTLEKLWSPSSKKEAGPNDVPDTDTIPAEPQSADGKLTVAEEVQEGHVSWESMKLFFLGLSGSPALFFTIFLTAMFATQVVNAVQLWYLGHWATQYESPPPLGVHASHYLGVYAILVLLAVGLFFLANGLYTYGTIRASRTIHEKLTDSILGTTFRWLDTTPTSRIISRCTQDIQTVDGSLAEYFALLVDLTASMVVKLGAVMVLTPSATLPGLLITLLGGLCGQIYIKAQLSVKREMSNAKAPMLGHFSASIAGLVSIRAYGAKESFQNESLEYIDRCSRATNVFNNLNRWASTRIRVLGSIFAAGVTTYLVYWRTSATSADVGFSLNMIFSFSMMIMWWTQVANEFEVHCNSLERIHDYLGIAQEPKPTEGGKPPAAWPTSGDVRVENLVARYSSDGPKVLHDVNFHIKSGERIGVVGRTGSGKSSLTLSLLRCIETEGTVYYDGLPTSSLNLDALRSSVTVIPQSPELLSGTLRYNLDPFAQHDDAALNDALRAAGLAALQRDDGDDGRIALDSAVAARGSNLSVGQRQVVALARALVRRSKLLILDEATSSIDYKTDAVIQASLRNELHDVTLITVAHRLQTIMDSDRIMVLDAGRIAEFDTPEALLARDGGLLRLLVNESSDRDTLEAMVRPGP